VSGTVIKLDAKTGLDTLAAEVMAEHEASHLVVTHATSGHPVGVLSTLDLAAVIASV